MCAPSKPTNGSAAPSQQGAPSMMARYTCASILLGVFAVWGKYAFPAESDCPGVSAPMHSWKVPATLTVGYLISLPVLRYVTDNFIAPRYDMKLLLTESMVLYNVGQVLLNGWMVWRFIDALKNGHPFIGDIYTLGSGASYAVWVHYCDKYLEFLDTYFMVLRGKMDQVSFLHVYHHTTIAWAWWAGVKLFPGGDAYFGALLNSWIHVMMYSYYALALLKIQCPWKRYLTQAQLLQFASVVVYSAFSATSWKVEERETKHYVAIVIQVWEMVSLFILFSLFYKKSYGKKKKGEENAKKKVAATDDVSSSAPKATASRASATDDDDDQCQAAIGALTSTTNEVIGSAAKDAQKMVSSAKKTIAKQAGQVQKEVEGAMSRPSWSIVS